jgi:hypothetical protein
MSRAPTPADLREIFLDRMVAPNQTNQYREQSLSAIEALHSTTEEVFEDIRWRITMGTASILGLLAANIAGLSFLIWKHMY